MGAVGVNVTVTTMNPTYRPEEIARQMENSETKYVLLVRNTGLLTKDETAKTIQNSKNMTIFGFCT